MIKCILTRNLCYVTVIFIVMFSGCTANRLAYDHKELRAQVLTLYDNQIMDNLIRSYNGDIPIHLKYSNFTGESITEAELKGHMGDDDKDTYQGGLIELDEDRWGVDGSAKIHNKLTLSATPVDKKEAKYVYDNYRKYAKDESFFKRSLVPPENKEWPKDPNEATPKNSNAIFKLSKGIGWVKENDKYVKKTIYYWIPATDTCREKYYNLAINTSHMQAEAKEETEIVEETVTKSEKTATKKSTCDKIPETITTKKTFVETKYADLEVNKYKKDIVGKPEPDENSVSPSITP